MSSIERSDDRSQPADRPGMLERQDSDVSNASSTGELFDMDPLRRDSATTVGSSEELVSPMFDSHSLHRPVIVRGSRSDERRTRDSLVDNNNHREQQQGDEAELASKGVVAQGKEMMENGIGNLAAKWKSFGFAGGKSHKPIDTDQHPAGPSNVDPRLPANTVDQTTNQATSTSFATSSSIGRTRSPNRNLHGIPPLHTSRPRIPSPEFQHHQHHYQHHPHHQGHQYESSELTPRAEHPPDYSPKSMAETVTSPKNARREMRTSADQEDEEMNASSSSRNGTIKRRRDTTVRKSLLLNRGERPSQGTGQDDRAGGKVDRKADAPGGYFPDVDELKRKAKQQRDAEKAKRKSDALARRARASALATFATSPRANSPFTSPTAVGNSPWRTAGKNEVESASDSENSGTDEMETPWPSSARHGDTPLGLEHEMVKSSRANSLRERMNSMGSIEEKHARSPFASRRNSVDRRSSSDIQTDEDEVLQAGTGCAISNPLAPPPGYPLYSPSIGSEPSDRPWMRSSSYAGSSANSSPPLIDRFHSATEALPVNQSAKGPYGQYFGFLPTGSQSQSQGSSASGSGTESELQRRLYSRFETAGRGLHIDNSTPTSGSSSISLHNVPSPNDSPRLNTDTEGQESSPFEGKITIDTSPDRYVISVGEMVGFSLENITIAVKSINRSSSTSSSVPRTGLVHSHSSDASSVHSHSSARSNASFHGVEKLPIQRTASPDIVAEGKVLHLIADRWEDSG
jgi:hypothetical protein